MFTAYYIHFRQWMMMVCGFELNIGKWRENEIT